MKWIKAAFSLLKETFTEWNEDKAPRLAAALSYYTALSIAPMLGIVIAIAGLAFGEEAARGEIVNQVQGAIGRDSAEAIEEIIANAYQPNVGIVATIIGVVTLVLGAAGFFGQLQDAHNTIWEVTPKPGQGILAMIRQRFISFTMVLGIGFLLLVSLILSTMLTAASTYVQGFLPQTELIARIVNFVISFGGVTLLFALIYKILPDAEVAWRDVWVGAAMTALLFTIGRFALSLYLGNTSVASAYGAAGSFVVILLWVYYSAQILLFGAEFTQVYARRYGSRIQPSENAVAITEEARIQQGMAHSATIEAAAAENPPAPVPARPVTVHISKAADGQEAPTQNHNFVLITLTIINAALAALIAGFGFTRRDSAKD